jgi:hypothetical protein
MPAEHHATLRLIAAATLLALAATAGAQKKNQAPATKKLYCWTENGRKVCGDALPAEAAGTSRTEYSKGGRRTGEVAAALTPEERAAAEAAAIAAVAKAESDAARTRREMAMVESYATEQDLRKAFQERIDLLDETLKASELGVVGLRQSLVGLLRQAGELELAGKTVPVVARNNITTQHAELRRRERLFAHQQVERAQLDEELAAVLARYREIKGGENKGGTQAAAPEAAPAPTGG